MSSQSTLSHLFMVNLSLMITSATRTFLSSRFVHKWIILKFKDPRWIRLQVEIQQRYQDFSMIFLIELSYSRKIKYLESDFKLCPRQDLGQTSLNTKSHNFQTTYARNISALNSFLIIKASLIRRLLWINRCIKRTGGDNKRNRLPHEN